ncbi:MAG: serine hydrolase domain-containing protein [Bacteroidota bacterium]
MSDRSPSWIRLLAVGAGCLLAISSCKIAWRAIRYNQPAVTDHRLFPERPIHRAGDTLRLPERLVPLPPTKDWALGKWYRPGMTPEDYFQATGTVAFLLIRDDTLRYEHYDRKFGPESRFNSFSMSKSVISVLTGIALEEGHLDSLDQSIGDYLDFCRDSSLRQITVRHLLQMTSGLHSTEGYLNPWATSTRLYYGDRLYDLLADLRTDHPPGTKFQYINLNYQLLGMVVAEATGRPLAQYFEEKIWRHLNTESDAGWSLHEDTEVEKGFCCWNARARDFARFGQLILAGGKWQDQQLIPPEWLRKSFSLDTAQGSRQSYQFGWYTSAEQEDVYAEGLLGQFIYVAPAQKTVIVRLGNSLDFNVRWYLMFKFLAGLKTRPPVADLPRAELLPLEGTYTFGRSNYGDTTLVGKKATVRATARGLKVKAEFGKPWRATPSSDSTFFNLRFSRNLRIRYDAQGQPRGLRWERRGNAWELEKVE